MTLSYDVDPASLSVDERIAVVREIEREIARLHARQVRLVAAVADDRCAGAICPELDREMVTEELRAALGESAVAVANRICLARALTGRLSVTLSALAAGEITLRHARLLAEAVIPLPDPAAGAVEQACVPFATGRDLAAFARKVRREVLKVDARSGKQQLDAALADRRVWAHADDPAGVSVLGAVLPAEGAQALMAALDLLADRPTGPGDERTREQRRADALVQLGVDALTGYPSCPTCGTQLGDAPAGSGPRWHGLRPSVQVSVALSTLLGLDDQPGDLDGHGPIPAVLARRLAADPSGTWRRLVTDPLGRLVDYGRTRYRPRPTSPSS
jgi:hypothetical protein